MFEAYRWIIAASITGLQGFADLIPSCIGAVEFKFITDNTCIGVGKVGLPEFFPFCEYCLCLFAH